MAFTSSNFISSLQNLSNPWPWKSFHESNQKINCKDDQNEQNCVVDCSGKSDIFEVLLIDYGGSLVVVGRDYSLLNSFLCFIG